LSIGAESPPNKAAPCNARRRVIDILDICFLQLLFLEESLVQPSGDGQPQSPPSIAACAPFAE
jgi:hypothetical protein